MVFITCLRFTVFILFGSSTLSKHIAANFESGWHRWMEGVIFRQDSHTPPRPPQLHPANSRELRTKGKEGHQKALHFSNMFNQAKPNYPNLNILWTNVIKKFANYWLSLLLPLEVKKLQKFREKREAKIIQRFQILHASDAGRWQDQADKEVSTSTKVCDDGQCPEQCDQLGEPNSCQNLSDMRMQNKASSFGSCGLGPWQYLWPMWH